MELLVCVLCLPMAASPAAPEPTGDRVALLIGNDTYGEVPLANAANDARDLGQRLEELGFDVDVVLNAGLEQMVRAIDDFSRKIRPESVALLHYSGHGFQIEGENYLVPVDYSGQDEVDAKTRTYPVSRLLGKLNRNRPRLKIIILDACRNNPYLEVRGGTRGLAILNAGSGSVITYATAPGQTASDASRGRNGLFTHHLLATLRKPGLSVEQVFKETGKGVQEDSKGHQEPWMSTSFLGEFAFIPAAPSPAPEDEPAGPYPKSVLDRYQRLLTSGRWREATPARNEHGLQEAVHLPTGLVFILVPPGEYLMGSGSGPARERPRRRVTVPAFLLSKTECTRVAWNMARGEASPAAEEARHPVAEITWTEAEEWCGAVGLRLPSEAEWEYACRAGGTGSFSFGDEEESLAAHAWFDGNSQGRAHAVRLKAPNPWGFHDLHGNVWEWCADAWLRNYEGGGSDAGPRLVKGAEGRVRRGGGYGTSAGSCRSATRVGSYMDTRAPYLGFRPAAVLP